MWDPLCALGALTAAWLLLWAVWGAGRAIYVYLLPWVRRDARWFRSHGAWAVVTGATDGIGKAYAHEFAKKGLNIVLISRNLNKLQQEAKEIERLHGTETRIIQADFTGGLEIYGAIEEGLKGLEIGILVNNVGMCFNRTLGKLLDLPNPAKNLSDIMNCNMMSVVQMTRIVLPQMVSRHRGIIINLSSLAESRPNPFFTAYSATKAFVKSFSLAVAAEYFPEGITVQTVSPAAVSTHIINNPKTGLLVKNVQDWIEPAVHTIGLSSHTAGCLNHGIQVPTLGPAWAEGCGGQFLLFAH
ncbi:PREDICTED: estradiol 17-beta-dehydrogenase 12-like [Chrysochloris asiatica]|uniref:17beta-estradiol 17-dehydrogenase n=1 Tax=Chrysochloris asiatica TaxID=185453 RepID=A0A9B0U151_CHRAS|nr:PREDICTED: estradiol 17-beta-dehydrogenase 12-like [Chrysochloris asiatica]